MRRVREVTAREIAWRLNERIRSELERICIRSGIGQQKDNLSYSVRGLGDKSFLDYLRTEPAHRFYFTRGSRPGRVKFIQSTFPQWIEDAAEAADRARRHSVTLLGFEELNLGPEIDWHRDPVTGKRWEIRFWTEYDPVRKPTAGDPKTIHELNRQRHIPLLGKAFFLTGEEKYAAEALAQIDDWIAQNPPLMGINWQSSLEIALRTIAWIWTLFFLLPSRTLDEALARKIGQSLFAQIDHISRHPSIYSSPNTHLVGEATALLIAGLIFTEHRRSEEWRSLGARLLFGGMDRQVLADGMHAELSSYYHCYALDFYLQAIALVRRNNVRLSERVWLTALRMLEVLMHLSRPDGSVPLLGDDDGGRALPLVRGDYRSVRDLLCTGAVLFGRQDFKYAAGEFREETLWLLDERSWSDFQELDSSPPPDTTASFRESGYFVQRSSWSRCASQLIFDCGDLGKLGGGHGHADALSFILWLDGKEFLVDPGTFVYNGASEWRNHFRSTRAHNTVVVDGCDQSLPGSTFQWQCKAPVPVARSRSFADIEFLEGEHRGYERLPGRVVHKRRVLFLKPDYWVLLDTFAGTKDHLFEFNHHFAPEAELFALLRERSDEIHYLVRNGNAELTLSLFAANPVQSWIVRGAEDPIQGWVSDQYGRRQPAPALIAALSGSVPCTAITSLVPVPGVQGPWAMRRLEVEGRSEDAVGCCIVRGKTTDFFVSCPGVRDVRAAGFRMTGEMFWLRITGGILERFLALNATHLSAGASTIVDSAVPVPFVCDEGNQIVEEHA